MFKKTKLQLKLIISFSIIVLFAFSVTAAIFYRYVREYTSNDNWENMDSIAQSISRQLDSEVYSLDRISIGMLGSQESMDNLIKLNYHNFTPKELAFEKYGYQRIFDRLVVTLNTPILTSPMVSVINSEKNYFFSWSVSGLDMPYISQS